MSAAQASLLESISEDDLELGISAAQEGSTENLMVKPSVTRRRTNLQEIENLYTTVSLFCEVMNQSNKLQCCSPDHLKNQVIIQDHSAQRPRL